MLNLKYDISKYDDSVKVYLYNEDSQDELINIHLDLIITKQEFKKMTNIIEESSFPMSFAYMMIKDFRDSVERKIVELSLYIDDKNLKEKIISYAKWVANTPDSICSVDFMHKFANDIEKNIEFLKK